jgi:hypothetical protein
MNSMPHNPGADQTTRCPVTVTVAADPADPAALLLPPVRWLFLLRPVLTLPGGVRVCVDSTASDRAAEAWWQALASAAVYAGLWHGHRDHTPSYSPSASAARRRGWGR